MDGLGEFLSRPLFIIALALVHLLWILLNLHWVPWPPWDPYPFTMLATIASVESPFVALLVLSHQKRQGVKSEQDEKSVSEMQADIDPEALLERLRKALRKDEKADEGP